MSLRSFISIEYLGHIIGLGGLQMDPGKVKIIQDWPEPKKVKDIQSFLGFANFYRCYIHNYSDIVVPLTCLTKGLGSGGGVSGELIQSQKVTLCLTQSINRLCRVNQSSLSTAGKSQSNLVNKNQICRRVPQGNLMEILEA